MDDNDLCVCFPSWWKITACDIPRRLAAAAASYHQAYLAKADSSLPDSLQVHQHKRGGQANGSFIAPHYVCACRLLAALLFDFVYYLSVQRAIGF